MTKRTINIDGKIYKYLIGRLAVVIWTPEGKKIVSNQSEVTGKSWEELEKGQWKNHSGGWVTPKHIRQFIEANDYLETY